MLVQAILVGLVGAFGCLDYQLGTLYAFRPIVLCPLVGLVLGTCRPALPLAPAWSCCSWARSPSAPTYRLTKPSAACSPARLPFSSVRVPDGHRARHAIAVLSLTIGNITDAGFSIIVDIADKCAAKGNLKGIYAAHWSMGLFGCLEYFLLCGGAFYLGSDAIQGLLDFIPTFVIDGCGVAANILPAMGFAMLGRLVLTKQLVPFYFLGFLLCSYANVPVLGVALIAIIIGIDKFDLLGLGGASQLLRGRG